MNHFIHEFIAFFAHVDSHTPAESVVVVGDKD
jgi:hypothetical protein